jgi:hypothetical protein
MIRLLLLPLAYLAHVRVARQHLQCEHCAARHYWPPQSG